MTSQHEPCLHGKGGSWPGQYCCKCKFGLEKGPSLHEDSFYCMVCEESHPGSRILDGCPNWNPDNLSEEEREKVLALLEAATKRAAELQ